MNALTLLVRAGTMLLVLAGTPRAEAADGRPCADRAQVVQRLAERFGETLRSVGLQRDDAVVEVPCLVTGAGPATLPVSPLRGRELGLVQQVKAVDELVIHACRERSAAVAIQALASHPLVDSVTVARELWSGYRERLTPFYAGLR